MVTETFSQNMEDDGRAMLLELDKTDLYIKAAFWLWLTDQATWRFIVATPSTDRKGPLAVYREIGRIFRKRKAVFKMLDLSMMTVFPPTHPIVVLLNLAVSTGPGINGIRFSRNTINGQFIEDAFIYRLTK